MFYISSVISLMMGQKGQKYLLLILQSLDWLAAFHLDLLQAIRNIWIIKVCNGNT
jgi:hypothetical protein